MKNDQIAKLWLEKADEDLLYANAVINEVKIYGLLCFHCHQAVEKYLKAYLTLTGNEFRKTHKLAELLLLCIEGDKGFDQFREIITALDQYYIEPRYPLDSPKLYTNAEATEALDAAETVGGFVKNYFV